MTLSEDAADVAPLARRVKAVTVEPVLFAYFTALTVHITVSQQLLFSKYCNRYYGDDAPLACDNASLTDANFELQDSTSHLLFYCTVATTFPSVVVCTYLGAIGDSRSRKHPTIVPLLGATLAYALCALQAYYMQWDPLCALVSSFVLGASGYYTASLQTCFSYLTTSVGPDERTQRIAVAEAVLLLSLVAGSFCVGPLVQSLGLSGTYALLAAVSLLGVAYCLAWLDDSRPPSRNTAGAAAAEASEGGLRLVASMRDYFRCVTKKRPGHTSAYIWASLVAFLLTYGSSVGVSDVLYLYLTNVHDFSTSLYGYFTGAEYGARLVLGSMVLLCMRKWFDASDLTIALCGSMSGAVTYGLISAAVSPWMTWLAVPLNSPQLFYSVGLRSFISKAVPDDEQGKIFAFMSTSECLFTFLASLIFNNIYPLTLPFYPGLCFALAALLSLAAFVILAITANHMQVNGLYGTVADNSINDG